MIRLVYEAKWTITGMAVLLFVLRLLWPRASISWLLMAWVGAVLFLFAVAVVLSVIGRLVEKQMKRQ